MNDKASLVQVLKTLLGAIAPKTMLFIIFLNLLITWSQHEHKENYKPNF